MTYPFHGRIVRMPGRAVLARGEPVLCRLLGTGRIRI